MGLDPVIAETAEIAGNLVNFGKLLVPPELLTKAHPLSEAEIHLIRSSINATADFLAGIEFDGPVIETLRLMPERWDGGGPQGVEAEAIPMGSRIVAVANAFVAIASPRAWRPSSDIDAALNQLMERIGTQFDRRVVVALISYFDNRGGRARWSALVDGAAAPPAVA
jgi:HD-GYP domain-containing protein (c-di-GMP phosphodiesterase class II)